MADAADILHLPYEAKLRHFNPDDSWSCNELPVLHFFRNNPDFEFYWVIEYDVHYTGSWATLLDDLDTSSADLLGTAVATPMEDPEWCHWDSLRWRDQPLSPEHCIKSFMPFGRVSRAALAAIDEAYVGGLRGHPEATWPTVCRMRDLPVEDIGGDGPFTPDRWKHKHYWNTLGDPYLAPGSFVFRPPVARAEVEASPLSPLLWHPVKW